MKHSTFQHHQQPQQPQKKQLQVPQDSQVRLLLIPPH